MLVINFAADNPAAIFLFFCCIMEWFTNLLFGSSVAHTILVFAIAIAFGILLGRINFKGISLGVTWILFLAIAMSHFGLRVDPTTLHFV